MKAKDHTVTFLGGQGGVSISMTRQLTLSVRKETSANRGKRITEKQSAQSLLLNSTVINRRRRSCVPSR